MPTLGTLNFDVKLKDETSKQAEEIKQSLLSKLAINYDQASYEAMVTNLKNALLKESFDINVVANMDGAKQAVQDTLNQIGNGAMNIPKVDLGGAQSITGTTQDVAALAAQVRTLIENTEAARQAWRDAAKTYGESSEQAKNALAVYDKQRQQLGEQMNLLFSLKGGREALNAATKETSKNEQDAAKATKETSKAQREATRADRERTNSHVRLSGELMKGVHISASLKEAFTSLYSVHMLKLFLNNVIEIGGQLEKQRVSMGAILGDAAKANVLFDQIKTLAVKSPFGVVELDQYTKQLAAYGFEYNELYDMIKRLADISAGAGQDISRLTLALGHVKSQTYLTGYTMRQFSMNNIPMLKMLAEYYSELEGTMVSTAEVQERISKKKVSYEDVIEQIKRLTDEGGMFYDMQEKISDTVAAKWKNLRDAFSIMYGELAEGGLGDALKATAEGLTQMAIHGQELLAVITPLAAAFGAYKATMVTMAAVGAVWDKLVKVQVLVNATRAVKGLTTATKAQIVAQKALNVVMSLNPYAVAISAAAALGAAYIFLHEKTKTFEEKMQDLNETFEQQEADIKKDETAAKNYVKAMTDVNKTTDKRVEAYNKLIELYPDYLNSLTKEKALLLSNADAMDMVTKASRKKQIAMAQDTYDTYLRERIDLEKKFNQAVQNRSNGRTYSDQFGVHRIGYSDDEIDNMRIVLEQAQSLEDSAKERLDSLKATNDQIEELQSQRWFKDSEKYAGVFKDLVPEEGESRSDYFSRIKGRVSSLTSEISELDKTSEHAKEVLPELQDELSAAENIFYKALGGAKKTTTADKQAAKDLEKARKEAEQRAKEELKKAVDEMDDYIKSESKKFNLFEELFSETGDKEFASNAFKNGQIWDSYANTLRQRLEEMMGRSISDWDMDSSLAEKIFGTDTPALKLYQEIVEHIGNNWEESLKAVASAMKSTETSEQEIARLQKQIYEWENDTSDIDRSAQIKEAKDRVVELKTALFSTLPVYEQIFGDTAYRSIASIKEGIRQLNEIIANASTSEDGKSITSHYIDENGVRQDVELTLSEFRRLKDQGTKLFDAWKQKNPFSSTLKAFKDLKEILNDPDASPEEKAEGWAKLASSISACADVVGNFAGQLGDMFDKLGNEGMASAMEDVQAGMNTVSNIGKGFAEGGPFGGVVAAAGEVVGWIGRIADKHDKRLNKAIEESQREVKKLQNAYKNLEWEIGRQLTAITKEQTKQMINSLAKQKRELEKQRENEANKKKSDDNKLIDYDQQIEEMKQQMRDFYKELASDQYGVDLDSWASQISDAIVDAFAKGEDAMEAFNDTVADIMNSVVKNIVKIGVVKPAMEELQRFLFGDNGVATLNSEGGVQITAKEAAELVGQLDALRSKISTGKTIYDAVADAMKALGIDPSSDNSSSSGGLSKGIQGTTEETSNLLASYLNAVRADVSVIRQLMQGGAVDETPIVQAQLQQLQMIADFTGQTARNTESISQIYDMMVRNTNGTVFFHIK